MPGQLLVDRVAVYRLVVCAAATVILGEVLGYLLVIIAALVVLWIAGSLITERTMPFTCPSCFKDGYEDFWGQPQPWFVTLGDNRFQCYLCGQKFKNSPNATLVEDRDP